MHTQRCSNLKFKVWLLHEDSERCSSCERANVFFDLHGKAGAGIAPRSVWVSAPSESVFWYEHKCPASEHSHRNIYLPFRAPLFFFPHAGQRDSYSTRSHFRMLSRNWTSLFGCLSRSFQFGWDCGTNCGNFNCLLPQFYRLCSPRSMMFLKESDTIHVVGTIPLSWENGKTPMSTHSALFSLRCRTQERNNCKNFFEMESSTSLIAGDMKCSCVGYKTTLETTTWIHTEFGGPQEIATPTTSLSLPQICRVWNTFMFPNLNRNTEQSKMSNLWGTINLKFYTFWKIPDHRREITDMMLLYITHQWHALRAKIRNSPETTFLAARGSLQAIGYCVLKSRRGN